ncbi:hypothetical protein NONI108955_33755 [Nocardia ninae]|uniref:Uncharacterized protein n=1 Tax=Nocardia ninae NBRC 108245 TaxID=1210091 RepID=A0A511M5M2_9NOCA|nr:hypothetical protein [Nocardia ninae]GEM35921.1 hypothetical protein NN4_04400 [Nocardia ninae NBRC 108245]
MEVRQLHPSRAVIGATTVAAPIYILLTALCGGAAIYVLIATLGPPYAVAGAIGGGLGVGGGAYLNDQRRTSEFGSLDNRIGFEHIVRGQRPTGVNLQWLHSMIERELRRTSITIVGSGVCGAAAAVAAVALGLYSGALILRVVGAVMLITIAAVLVAVNFRRRRQLQLLNSAMSQR